MFVFPFQVLLFAGELLLFYISSLFKLFQDCCQMRVHRSMIVNSLNYEILTLTIL